MPALLATCPGSTLPLALCLLVCDQCQIIYLSTCAQSAMQSLHMTMCFGGLTLDGGLKGGGGVLEMCILCSPVLLALPLGQARAESEGDGGGGTHHVAASCELLFRLVVMPVFCKLYASCLFRKIRSVSKHLIWRNPPC